MPASANVLFVTSECAPWAKTGGLADVSASLPAALRQLGVDARVMMPAYAGVPRDAAAEWLRLPAGPHFPAARVLASTLPGGVPVLLLECPSLYEREGGPYQTPAGHDWPDNALRFGLLCRAAAALATGARADWLPQVVHCNDWQTGLIPVYLSEAPQSRAATLLTIHNLAFQGLFDARVVAELSLPPSSYSMDGLEFYGKCSFLKGGLAFADALTTVSPSYAAEIQTEALGMGMHGVLQRRREVLTGIVNGIDNDTWDPAADPHIPRRYGPATLDDKVHNKRALQARAGLPASDAPVLAMVSRLTEQKGVDWLIEIAPALAGLGAQLVVLGTGNPAFEHALRGLADRHADRISVTTGFDESYAHLIEAGADIFLMPSRFEPCGMNQMFSLRYGTVPIVRATGGLRDTVVDYGGGEGTGFVFEEAGAAGFMVAIQRALAVFGDAAAWRALQHAGMARDFGWGRSARGYLEIYRRIAGVSFGA